MVCAKYLHDCTCEDLAERMRTWTSSEGTGYSRWCAKCDQHYCRCECTEPKWMIRQNGELTPLPHQTIVVHGKPIEA